MDEIQKKIDEAQERFDTFSKEYEFHTKKARAAQIEMIRVQGEHRALTGLLPEKN